MFDFFFRTSSTIGCWLAICCGIGRLRPAPGTWGSLLGLAGVYFFSAHYLITIALTLIAWISIALYEQKNSHDNSEVVIDEVVGIFISFLFLPLTLPILVAGFFIFRVLDILKPFPISWLDKNVPGAFGTLFDDMVAGALTAALLHSTLAFGIF